MRKNFKGSIIFTLIALVLGFVIGAGKGLNIMAGFSSVFIILILGVLETSLSFDNAVVNATVLKKMDPVWQHRFLTRGIAIAVFGMRIIFPLLIVAIVGGLNPISVLNLAVFDPSTYANILGSAHIAIEGFGGSFLLLVALSFFFNSEKEYHWIKIIEKFLQKIGQLESVEIVFTLLILFLFSKFLPSSEMLSFVIAGIWGIIVFVLIEGLTKLLNKSKDVIGNVGKIGLYLFLYLEVLDASFSFDGVIGAFALSKNIFIIALGLGIGAMFVRSLTIMLVRKGTLAKYKYLEHGAFWAILALAVIMFLNTIMNVPEIITGLLGALFIGFALWSSIIFNKKGIENK